MLDCDRFLRILTQYVVYLIVSD